MDWFAIVDSAMFIVKILSAAFLALGAGLALDEAFAPEAPMSVHRSDAEHA